LLLSATAAIINNNAACGAVIVPAAGYIHKSLAESRAFTILEGE